ncbi:MAG: hypothetical protein ABWY11_18140, partial [Umezawaea sp.]
VGLRAVLDDHQLVLGRDRRKRRRDERHVRWWTGGCSTTGAWITATPLCFDDHTDGVGRTGAWLKITSG